MSSKYFQGMIHVLVLCLLGQPIHQIYLGIPSSYGRKLASLSVLLEYYSSSKDEDRLFLSYPSQSYSLHLRVFTSYDKAPLIPFKKSIVLAVFRWWLLKYTSFLGHCASQQVRLCSSKAVRILGLRRPEWGFFVHFTVLRSSCGWKNLDEVNLIVIKGHFNFWIPHFAIWPQMSLCLTRFSEGQS